MRWVCHSRGSEVPQLFVTNVSCQSEADFSTNPLISALLVRRYALQCALDGIRGHRYSLFTVNVARRCQNVGSVKESRVQADCGTPHSTIDAAFRFPVSEVPGKRRVTVWVRNMNQVDLDEGIYLASWDPG